MANKTKEKENSAKGAAGVPRLLKFYREEVVPKLLKTGRYKNVMEVPRFVKVVLNMGVGDGARDPKVIDSAVKQLSIVAGQKPVVRRAKKSIAGFKIRAGMPVGVSVTLRGKRMWYFLDRFFNLALPRVRDFQGLSGKSFDGRGNFTFGVREQLIFPEVEYDDIDRIRGLNVTIVTTARNDDQAYELFKAFGVPMREET